jgi:hypothetical protein
MKFMLAAFCVLTFAPLSAFAIDCSLTNGNAQMDDWALCSSIATKDCAGTGPVSRPEFGVHTCEAILEKDCRLVRNEAGRELCEAVLARDCKRLEPAEGDAHHVCRALTR